jgi:hypothetical protein
MFCHASAFLRCIEPLVNGVNFARPTLPVPVFQPHDLVQRPVKIVRDIGYLLE